MLRVTIELVPHGNENYKKKIAQMCIANDGSGTYAEGNYEAVIAPDDWSMTPEIHTKVKGFNRRDSVWELIFRVLKNRKKTYKRKSWIYHALRKRMGLEPDEQSAEGKS